MAVLENVVEYVKSLDSTSEKQIEIEFKLLLDRRIKSPSFVASYPADIKNAVSDIIRRATELGAKYMGVSETINFIKSQENMFVKQLVYIDGIQDKDKKIYYSKKSLIAPIYLVPNEKESAISLKLSINMETKELADINEFDLIRARLRYSLQLEDWRIDITFIKETRDTSISVIKAIRDKLFGCRPHINKLADEMDWTYPDRIETEVEYTAILREFGINKIQKIKQIISYSESLTNKQDRTYQECICEIAQLIRPTSIDKFRDGTYGLKQLGSNPLELSKKVYMADIIPSIDNYIITEKIDGIRSMLIIDIIQKRCYVINNKNANGITIHNIDVANINTISVTYIILDAEAVDINTNGGPPHTHYYIFDVLQIKN